MGAPARPAVYPLVGLTGSGTLTSLVCRERLYEPFGHLTQSTP